MNDATLDAHVLLQTDHLYERISAIISSTSHDGTLRSKLASALAAITLEHGYSIRALIQLDHLTSAIALLRTQFESVTRAVWVHYAASSEWVAKNERLLAAGALNEPQAPSMNDMLDAISRNAPGSVGRMLGELKAGAWKPLNSYVHGGIHPITQHRRGYSKEYALQTLRNSNGLATMAAMLLAVMSGQPDIAAAIRETQLEHLDCLPPLTT